MADEPRNVGWHCIVEGLECHAMVPGAHPGDRGKPLHVFRRGDVTQPGFDKANSEGMKRS